MSNLPTFSAAEVAAHGTRDDLWITVQGKGQSNMSIQYRAILHTEMK